MTTVKFQNPLTSVFGPFFNQETDYLPNYKQANVLVNVIEQADAFLLQIVAAGYSKEDIKLSIQNRQLSIVAEAKPSTLTEGEKWVRKEFVANGFKRNFSLPLTVDTTAINASYEQGILSISIPKKEEEKIKEPQAINIQ
jgi:HSP20 family protein